MPQSEKVAKIFKGLGLVSLVPAVLVVPYMLTKLGEVHARFPFILPAVWICYAAITLLIVFVIRRKTMTWDSFTTQNLAHIILGLGAYHFLSVAQMVPMEMRRSCLWLWVTLTMAINIVVMLLDTTDYRAQQIAEEEKQKRKEAKRQAWLEERKKMKEEKMKNKPPKPLPIWKRNHAVKLLLDTLIYTGMIALVVWIGWALVLKSQEWKARTEAGIRPGEENRAWGYESRTGQDYKPTEVTEEELAQTTTTKRDPFEVRDDDLE